MNLFGIDLLYSASGLAVGILVGLTGVGGGSLMTPLLVLLFGIHPATAVGTDLLYASITKAAGTAMHGFNRTVDWRVTGQLALGSLPAALATLAILAWVGQSRDTSRIISVALGYALIATAASFLGRRWILAAAEARRASREDPSRTALLTVATGAAIGCMVSLSSVGAGALGITALILLYPTLPLARIVGSDIAHAVPLTLAAGIGHWAIGGVDWALLGALLTGSIPGILIGSHLAPRMPEAVLRGTLATVLAVVGAKLILS
ncbi:sulfite exporter TauE/SafE family protein [Prosthecomicrobium sp. N25]|uniref:sulfite exporter TauE/SafE family protein n=1 Tax=Prosthecomicrobium sp. N25 TaxID=3129254 RepID=UPI0030778ED7